VCLEADPIFIEKSIEILIRFNTFLMKQRTFQNLKRDKRRGAARFYGSLERLGARKKKEEPMVFLFIVV
jgi:hypothetical protein